MSEQPQSIQPPDEPLEPYTLRIVIERLTAGIDDAVQYPVTGNTTSYEGGLFADNFYDRNDWQLAIDATALAREVVRGLLATANPRARVVVLPEQVDFDTYDDAYLAEWPGDVSVRAFAAVRHVYIPGGLHTVDEARTVAASALAAAEFAGGAKFKGGAK